MRLAHADPLGLYDARPLGRVSPAEVLGSPKLCASIVGMFAAGMDSDEIGNRLVIPEAIVERVLHSEREKQVRGL